MSQFRALTAGKLDTGTCFQRPRQTLPVRRSLHSPAMDVSTPQKSQATSPT